MGTYTFSYTTPSGSFKHLASITSSTYPAANYTFTYFATGLHDPFSGSSFSNEQLLWTITNTSASLTTTFTTNWSGELTKVVFPYQGYLRWDYTNNTFASSRTQREVQTRYLAMSSGASELTYQLSHPNDTGTDFHSSTQLLDAALLGQKQWSFDTTSGHAGFGMQISYLENSRPTTTGTFSTVSQTAYTWTTDSLGHPYIGTVTTTLDGTAQKKTVQALDQYGNVQSMNLYDFGAANPTRTYTNTYLTDASSGHPAGSDYGTEHIHNRLLTSTVTQNGQVTTLVSNSYDNYNPQSCGTSGTPQGWINIYPAGMLDLSNTNNAFRGNVTTSVGLDMTHNLCYATTGAVVARTDGGHTTTTQTDSSTNYTSPSAITTGSLTTTINWTSFLALSGETGPNGDAAGIVYDAASRPSSTTTPYGSKTTYSYSTSPPQTVATTTSNQTPALPSDGRWTRTTMDGFGRTVKTEVADSSNTVQSVTDVQYAACGCSPLGKLSQKSMPHTPAGTVYWTVYHYDGLGRTTSVVAPDGASATQYSYSANTVTVTDAAGKWKTFTMDAFGNLTKVVEPDTSQTSTNNQATTTYTYDGLNHLIGVSMPRQMPGGTVTQTRTFDYGTPPSAYLLSAAQPEYGVIPNSNPIQYYAAKYTYNVDGSLATKWDPKGQQQGYFLQYLYDSYGRLTTIQQVPGTPTAPSTPVTVLRTYIYDTNPTDSSDDPNYSQYSQGRLTRIKYNTAAAAPVIDNYDGSTVTFTPDGVTEMYTYNVPGQITGKRLRVSRTGDRTGSSATADLNATWTYNSEGNLTGASYPGDPNGVPTPPSYTYTYDGMGRLGGMSGSSVVSGVTYNAAGQLLTMGTESRTYNIMGQLTSIVSGTVNATYTYPAAGANNGKIVSQTMNGEQVSYAYDSLKRLISAQSGSSWGQGFKYDPFGNLTDKYVLPGTTGAVPTLSVVPDAATNHIGAVDANGNAAGNNYDVENRMISTGSVPIADGSEYSYDAQNKRVFACAYTASQSGCTAETYYFYSPSGKLIAQFTPAYTAPMRNNSNGLVPATLGWQNAGTRAYFGGRLLGDEDRLGSRGKYFPYGEERNSPLWANDQVKFATYTRDSATGLDYADQRYYTATYGRFLSPDRYAASGGPTDPQSWNRFTYSRGDPVNRFDPTGLQDEGPPDLPVFGYCDGLTTFFGDPCLSDTLWGWTPGANQTGGLGTLADQIAVAVSGMFWSTTLSGLKSEAAFISTDAGLDSEDCQDDLRAIRNSAGDSPTSDQIRSEASKVQFVLGNSNVGIQIGQNVFGPIYTMGAVYFEEHPTTYAATPYNSNVQYWAAGGGFGVRPDGTVGILTAGQMDGRVMHELLHNLGYTDDQIQKALFGDTEPSDTDNISRQLANDCFFGR